MAVTVTDENASAFETPDLVVAETGTYVPEQQAYLNLIRTTEVLGMKITDLLASHGLSGKQYNVLRSIRRGGSAGVRVSEIGAQMTDPRADTTRLVDRLGRDGLVARRHGEAGRRGVRTCVQEGGAALRGKGGAPGRGRHRDRRGQRAGEELRTLTARLKKGRGERSK